MATLIDSIQAFLNSQLADHNGPDLLARWTGEMETQVNVIPGQPVEDKPSWWTDGKEIWWPIRIPKNAKAEPTFKDYELRWSLDEHAEGIGMTGWNFVERYSLWCGFDFDNCIGHVKGLSVEELDRVKEAAVAVPWVEARKSTGGGGLHLYAFVDRFPTDNHTEHAKLAKAILKKLSEETGFDFKSRLDVCGGNMWFWHRKMNPENQGLALIKAAERKLAAEEIPSNWRNELPKPVPKPAASSGQTARPNVLASAVAAMMRMKKRDENDGSKRVLFYACRGVEYDLSDADIVTAVRACEKVMPLPRECSDEEIVRRIRDAEHKVQRGSARARRPELIVTSPDLDKLTTEVWKHVADANDPPSLFRYGGYPVRVERDDNDEPIPRPLTADHLRHHVAQWIDFRRQAGTEVVSCVPPMYLVKNVLATPDLPLPILDRITEAPVFAPDGELQTTPGYHTASRTMFAPKGDFVVPTVSAEPSEADVAIARDLIMTELLGDFPFIDDAEKAHAVGLMLLPFARSLIRGATPLHLFEKPSPGTGATLLTDALTFPATGHPVATMTEGGDEEEWRKRLTAKLRTSPTFLLIDNLRKKLDSAALAAAITSPAWEDRILGVSQMVKLPVSCGWLATGNNPSLSGEIARRTVRIRLNAKIDQPWLRENFRHPNLMGWASENRGRLVWAALTLIRAWLVKGRPRGGKTLGMFAEWSHIMGGILQNAGIRGFLANLTDFYDRADTEGAAWRGFLAHWWKDHSTDKVQAKDLLDLARESTGINLGMGGDQSQKIKLGQLLSGLRDRVFNVEVSGAVVPLRVDEVGTKARATVWQLQEATDLGLAVSV
jgi:hypothetical protein